MSEYYVCVGNIGEIILTAVKWSTWRKTCPPLTPRRLPCDWTWACVVQGWLLPELWHHPI